MGVYRLRLLSMSRMPTLSFVQKCRVERKDPRDRCIPTDKSKSEVALLDCQDQDARCGPEKATTRSGKNSVKFAAASLAALTIRCFAPLKWINHHHSAPILPTLSPVTSQATLPTNLIITTFRTRPIRHRSLRRTTLIPPCVSSMATHSSRNLPRAHIITMVCQCRWRRHRCPHPSHNRECDYHNIM